MPPTNTLGRFTLSFLGHKIGERLFVFLVTFGVTSPYQTFRFKTDL